MARDDLGPQPPIDAQLNATNEQGRTPVHEQHPLSAQEQRLIDQAAERQQRGGRRG